MDILEHLGMKEPDIEGHGVIMGGANEVAIHLTAESPVPVTVSLF